MVDQEGESNISTKSFARLPAKKQRRILQAAYQEFAENGHEQASTNRIVEEAGIGKGMLFYYFSSKQELFYYLIEHGVKYMADEYLNKLDEQETDFIEKYRQASQAKMRIYSRDPHILNFLASLHMSEELELPDEIQAMIDRLSEESYSKLFENIDTSLFREDVEPERVIKLIQWSMDGYAEEITNRLRGQNITSVEYGPFMEEFYKYLDILKKVYYKEA